MGCGKSKSLEQRVMMVGLDAAGKTTVLYRLHKGERVDTEPTLGFNVEVIDHAGAKLTIWDLGGQEKIRPCWQKYFLLANGIIFVVDSSEPARFDEAKNELSKMLKAPELKGAPLLVLANKQDNPGAVKAEDLTSSLALQSIAGERPFIIQLANATTGTGLWEGLTWLVGELRRIHDQKQQAEGK